MKRNCAGCRALELHGDFSSPAYFTCDLGLKLEKSKVDIYYTRLARFVDVRPIMNCGKPTTISKWIKLKNNK
jgi:hypothetical protein